MITPVRPQRDHRPRVLHVLEATLGGTLQYISNIVHAARHDRFRMALAYSTQRADARLALILEHARAIGWEIFRVDMVRAVSPARDLHSGVRLYQVLLAYRPDIIHCHSSKAGALSRLAARILVHRPMLLYSPHSVAASLGQQYLVAERLLAPLTDRFVAVSESERDQLIDLRIARHHQIDVVYPTVDVGFFSPQDRTSARQALGLPSNSTVIIGVGRLTGQKNPLHFLEIVSALASRRPGVRAIWLGDGHLRRQIEEKIRQTALAEVVHLPGWQQDVRRYLAAADLLLSTSRYESFGYMVAESLAMERPVVASSVPGTRDVLSEGLEELLYPVGDTQAAVQGVNHLLDNPSRASQLATLGRGNVERRFSQTRMGDSLSRCYTNLLAQSAALQAKASVP